jgi:hypothetical protein
MVEVQRILANFAESLPEIVNDCPQVSLGTTEQLCIYFFGLRPLLDPHITLVSVSVSEETGRVTSLSASEFFPQRLPFFLHRCANSFLFGFAYLGDAFRLGASLLAFARSTRSPD